MANDSRGATARRVRGWLSIPVVTLAVLVLMIHAGAEWLGDTLLALADKIEGL